MRDHKNYWILCTSHELSKFLLQNHHENTNKKRMKIFKHFFYGLSIWVMNEFHAVHLHTCTNTRLSEKSHKREIWSSKWRDALISCEGLREGVQVVLIVEYNKIGETLIIDRTVFFPSKWNFFSFFPRISAFALTRWAREQLYVCTHRRRCVMKKFLYFFLLLGSYCH